MTSLRIAELFAGIGGVTGGFLDAGGYEAVFLNDVDPIARSVFASNFPNLAPRYYARSVRGITGPEMLDRAGGGIDGLLGCPPCQGLSPAGLRKDNDDRNGLLDEVRRLVWSVRPKFFVLENVPSLLQTDVFQSFADSLAGSYDIHGEVVNAAEYGIPQLRRRAVIVGFRSDLDIEPTLPAPTHGGRGRVFDYVTGRYVCPRTTRGRRLLKLRPNVRLPRTLALVTLRKALGDLPTRVGPKGGTRYGGPPRSAYQERMRRGSYGLTNHQAWDHRPETVDLLSSVLPGDCPVSQGGRARNTTYFSQAYARLHKNGLARTITTNFHNPGSGRFTHYSAPRTLTIREALRLQGFPDTFSFGDDILASDAERLVGNAFPRPLARAIARHISRLLGAA